MARKSTKRRKYTWAQKAMLVASVLIIASMVITGVASVFSSTP